MTSFCPIKTARRLSLLTQMSRLIRRGGAQFVIATHSPILMTFPGATLLQFEGGHIESVRLEDTSHYQITKGILGHPERYWQHLSREDEPE